MKRKNELCEAVKDGLANGLIADHEGNVKELLRSYENATYKEYDDRHEWYADVMDSMVNDFGFKDDFIAEKMANNHPTIQQSFMRFCLKFIRKMAEKTYTDGRNEASVAIAREIVKVLDEKGSYLPFV